MGWNTGEAERQRSLESHPSRAPGLLSAGLRGTDPGRETVQGERFDFPFAAGQPGEALMRAARSSPRSGQARPGRAFICTVGQRAAQLLAGACGERDDLEVPVSLFPASRTASGACPGRAHTRSHLPVIRAPDGVHALHEVESVGVA